jgi:hypothetical protein
MDGAEWRSWMLYYAVEELTTIRIQGVTSYVTSKAETLIANWSDLTISRERKKTDLLYILSACFTMQKKRQRQAEDWKTNYGYIGLGIVL